jgi:hypothetical protein
MEAQRHRLGHGGATCTKPRPSRHRAKDRHHQGVEEHHQPIREQRDGGDTNRIETLASGKGWAREKEGTPKKSTRTGGFSVVGCVDCNRWRNLGLPELAGAGRRRRRRFGCRERRRGISVRLGRERAVQLRPMGRNQGPVRFNRWVDLTGGVQGYFGPFT